MMCDKKEVIYNRIIPPYVTGALKHSMQMTEGKTLNVWPKKMNHIFNEDKYY